MNWEGSSGWEFLGVSAMQQISLFMLALILYSFYASSKVLSECGVLLNSLSWDDRNLLVHLKEL